LYRYHQIKMDTMVVVFTAFGKDLGIVIFSEVTMKNAIFWVVTPFLKSHTA
jgi:hypothetical protein